MCFCLLELPPYIGIMEGENKFSSLLNYSYLNGVVAKTMHVVVTVI